jgi:hypothetical protein
MHEQRSLKELVMSSKMMNLTALLVAGPLLGMAATKIRKLIR